MPQPAPLSLFLEARRAIRRLAALSLLIAVALAACHAHSQQYQATGVASIRTYSGESVSEESIYRFTVAVDACNWCLRATVVERRERGTIQTNNFDYIEAGSDGESVYVVNSLQTQAKSAHAANVAVVSISKGSMPCDANMFIRDLWLGFASHCYFASVTNGWLYPIFLERGAASAVEGRFAVKGYWSTLPGAPSLPRTVVYTFAFDGKLRGANPSMPDIRGKTNAEYVVLSQQRLSDLVLPSHFKTRKYSPGGRLTQEVEVNVENVASTLSLRSFRPSVPGQIHLSDFRFANANDTVEPVTYLTTNWPSMEKIAPLRNLQQESRRAIADAQGSVLGARRAMVIGALIAPLVGSLFLLLRIMRGRGNAKHNH